MNMNRLYFSDESSSEYVAYERTPSPSIGRTAVVYLHGFMSDQSGEKAARLREELTFSELNYITFDFRGHGKSSGSIEEMTGTRLLEDLRLIDDRLCKDAQKLVLIGSSMGGWVASWYATLYPARIAACVLIAPALRFGDLLKRDAGEEGLRKWASTGWFEFTNEHGQVKLNYELIRDLARYPIDDLEQRLKAPTLIVHGLRDEIVDYKECVNFVTRSSNPDLELVLFKDADHRLTEHKDLLARRAAVFLREHSLISPQP